MGTLSNQMETSPVEPAKPKHRLSGQARFKMGATGIMFPTLALLISSGNAVVGTPHWQSGKIDQYVAMLLSWPGYGPFLPLVTYSMLSLLVWLWRDGMLRHFVVRLGLYTGVILTIQFTVLLMIVDPSAAWALLIAAPIFGVGQAAVVFGVVYLARNVRRFSIRYLLIITTVAAIAIAWIKSMGGLVSFAQATLAIPVVGAIASPVLSTITMSRAALHAIEMGQSRWIERAVAAVWEVILGWGVWIVGMVVAWRIAVEIMLNEYAKLPVTRPGCYVASAAAHGHPAWVKSQWVDGISMPVNDQLRRLKFLEIAIKAASPKLHRHARTVYDYIGPKMAALCHRSRWLSDAAYLLLRVPEAFAVTIQVIFRFRAHLVHSLYR